MEQQNIVCFAQLCTGLGKIGFNTYGLFAIASKFQIGKKMETLENGTRGRSLLQSKGPSVRSSKGGVDVMLLGNAEEL
eukprot:463204-Amphidinium_carterae.1